MNRILAALLLASLSLIASSCGADPRVAAHQDLIDKTEGVGMLFVALQANDFSLIEPLLLTEEDKDIRERFAKMRGTIPDGAWPEAEVGELEREAEERGDRKYWDESLYLSAGGRHFRLRCWMLSGPSGWRLTSKKLRLSESSAR